MNRHSVVCEARPQGNQPDAGASSVLTVDPGALLRERIDRSAHEHKAIAVDIGYQPDYWCKVLSSERGITLDRLGQLPIDVQRAWIAAWGESIGVQAERRGDGHQDVRALVELIATRRVRISIEAK